MHPPVDPWPALPLAEWRDTYETLHLWAQAVGKVRLALTPVINHWWNSTLYVTARGLTTGTIPYRDGAFELRFDFLEHKLVIETSWHLTTSFALQPQTCADFFASLKAALVAVGVDVGIWPVAVELPKPVRLDTDQAHFSYDAKYVHRWWRAMLTVDTIFNEFRARFIGKSSPSHFFWGSFDLAVTRFSGRRAPERPGADAITREAYSHECVSAGFWPGSGAIADAAFYAYAAPQPAGFESAPVKPAAAFFDPKMNEYFLMYEDVRKSPSPRETLLDFLQSTYEAGANLGNWKREELERKPQ
ncbi:MAG TPA: DUF5996 family protein [Thermoanaerobaculia bacterium]|jgi:hypothetical protein